MKKISVEIESSACDGYGDKQLRVEATCLVWFQDVNQGNLKLERIDSIEIEEMTAWIVDQDGGEKEWRGAIPKHVEAEIEAEVYNQFTKGPIQ